MFREWWQAVTVSLFWEYRSILLSGLAINFTVFGLAGVRAGTNREPFTGSTSRRT